MSSLKQLYLYMYNLAGCILWTLLLARVSTVVFGPTSTYRDTYVYVGEYARNIQTAALLEIVHSAIGLVRAPLIPTFIQTVAKNLILWTIVQPFPSIASSPAYTILIIAWSTGEVIRYLYFSLLLSGVVPKFITWLRYSAFVLIYPIGIGSEMWLILQAIGQCDQGWLLDVMWGELALYIPGMPFLYSYMLKQRRKTIGSKAAERKQRH
ncbi:tyrosine phosphatase-like protein [Calycina marina]|uniref:Very-long-chain (3R)-3-hydroxyacyl-CoA dehydratase n=1 Tax=Calycina marina TaxID=1763456 RepID=A0A9P8CCX6_9HELO|nr:tyrosine phosphatase-like protein [Calycina marina]